MTSQNERPIFETSSVADPVTGLFVDDPISLDDLQSALDDEQFQFETASGVDAALDRLDDVDCVVSPQDRDGRTGLDLLAAVRERSSTLPFVIVTDEPRSAVVESLCDDDWAAVLQTGDQETAPGLLGKRLLRLVRLRRTATLGERSLAAVEIARGCIAVVAPDETYQYVNQAYASQFGYEADDLVGRDWRECFPDEEAERLERTALESVADGWLWTGGSRGRRADGETVPIRTRITGLDDGSLVFALYETDDGD